MQYNIISKILGILLILFSLSAVPSAAISLLFEDGTFMAFIGSFVLIFSAGLLLWAPFRHHKGELRTKEGFLITALFWLVLASAGAVPFVLAPGLELSITDAFFESLSGLTTTGATIIVGIDDLPKGVLFYRQQLQWLGGMGIIVLAVAVLPMLGIGGMQLYRAETPGPVKDSKLTPRIAETAKVLWAIYLTLTIICALAYWFAGMDWFDAIGHAFSTVAIGGFSTHDASIGYFDSQVIESIAIVFMLLASANFSLHYIAWQRRSLLHYFVDPEYRFFLFVMAMTVVITCSVLALTHAYEGLDAVRYGAFKSVSIMTTTGFGLADFHTWPLLLPFSLFLTSFIGGCAGSTAGGMKSIRILLLLKQGMHEIQKLIHPEGVFVTKVGNRAVPDKVMQAVWGFFAMYVMTFVALFLALLSTGLDFITSWSAIGSALNNLGPGLGDVAAHYGNINDVAKWILCLAMLMGRLEIFTLVVLFTPMFWRK